MKIKLLRDARLRHHAGEIVEVSPAEAGFLISTASAELMKASERETQEEKTKPVRETRKK